MLVGVIHVSEVTHCHYIFVFAYSLSSAHIIKQAFLLEFVVILMATIFTSIDTVVFSET